MAAYIYNGNCTVWKQYLRNLGRIQCIVAKFEVKSVIRTVRARIYPDIQQDRILLNQFELGRWLYNYFLGIVKACQKVPEKTLLSQMIPALSRYKPELTQLYSTSRQYILQQLCQNIKVQLAQKGKFNGLRFKGKGRQRTIHFHQWGFKLVSGAPQRRQMRILRLGKVGDVRIRLHRVVDGIIKQVCVKLYPSGKWYSSIQVEQDQPINCTPVQRNKHVGIDVGIIHFIYDSTGNHIEHPRDLEKLAKKLAHTSRQLSRARPNSRNRQKARRRVARIYETLTNKREVFLQKISRQYVNDYDVIGREKLDIRSIIRALRSGKNVLDASWGKFFRLLDYKAESAGKLVVEVPAPNSGIECSGCRKLVAKTLAVRIHSCPHCGIELDRDHNSAKVIDHRAVEKIGWEASE